MKKVPSGIDGLDQVMNGGLPQGRPTLLCGGPGCGKTLFAVQFLVRAAMERGEPGVLLAFEETAEEIRQNVASLGFDLQQLIDQKLLAVDYVHIDRAEIEETGEYDLEGLFVRLQAAIQSVGAKRVVLDTIEALFTGFDNSAVLRTELRRLFRWLKERGVTAIITAERGERNLTQNGLEEYVSDCVILLDHRVEDQVTTRRLRVVKYRGSSHGTNEYPFLISEKGLSVLPVTALGLDYPVSTERVSTGVPELDRMFGGKGYFRGSSVLVSGSAGTGKSSIAACFADATCRARERCIYFALEESSDQIVRNMSSIGLDLAAWERKKLLRIIAARPTVFGLEQHLLSVHKALDAFQPRAVVLDPISSLLTTGTPKDVKSMLVRLLDHLKLINCTAMLTCLTPESEAVATEVGISSLIDTWIQVRDLEHAGERNRGIFIIKSRGMKHSNQVREFVITDAGLDLIDVVIGAEGVLTGSARLAQTRREQTEAAHRAAEVQATRRELERKRKALDVQIASLTAAHEEQVADAERRFAREADAEVELNRDRAELARGRGGRQNGRATP